MEFVNRFNLGQFRRIHMIVGEYVKEQLKLTLTIELEGLNGVHKHSPHTFILLEDLDNIELFASMAAHEMRDFIKTNQRFLKVMKSSGGGH